MTSLPLHPVLVHLPLALAFVMPVLAIGFAWASWRERIRPRAWIALVALQAVLLGAGFVAMSSGEREEDRVERIVPEAALELHEEYASQFMWATGVTLGLAGLVLASRKRTIVRSMTVATVAGSLVVAAAAARVGHAGGRLVYVHNAGAAYASPGPDGRSGDTGTDAARATTRRSHEDGR